MTTTTVGAAAGFKALGGVAGVGAAAAGLAAVVVMLMTWPENKREQAVALISTVVGSMGGGAAVVMYFDLQAWAHSYMGLAALFGLAFACGCPAWLVLRWWFRFAKRSQDKAPGEILREVRDGAIGK